MGLLLPLRPSPLNGPLLPLPAVADDGLLLDKRGRNRTRGQRTTSMLKGTTSTSLPKTNDTGEGRVRVGAAAAGGGTRTDTPRAVTVVAAEEVAAPGQPAPAAVREREPRRRLRLRLRQRQRQRLRQPNPRRPRMRNSYFLRSSASHHHHYDQHHHHHQRPRQATTTTTTTKARWRSARMATSTSKPAKRRFVSPSFKSSFASPALVSFVSFLCLLVLLGGGGFFTGGGGGGFGGCHAFSVGGLRTGRGSARRVVRDVSSVDSLLMAATRRGGAGSYYPVRCENATQEASAVSTSTEQVASVTTLPRPSAAKASALASTTKSRPKGRTRTRRNRRSIHSSVIGDAEVRERLERQYRQLLQELSPPQEAETFEAGTGASVAVSASLGRAAELSSSTSWSIASPVTAQHQPRGLEFGRTRPRKGLRFDGATTAPDGAVETSPSNQVSEDKDSDKEAAITRARYLLLVAAALYGTNFSCVKLLLMGQDHALPVGASSTVRFGMAALATAPWLIPHSLKEFNLKSSSVAAIVAGLEVGAWNSIGYVAQAIGLETTEASKSAFLCSLAVVVVPVLDYLFKGKKMQGKQVVGTTMALVGVAILELGGMLATGGDAASAAGATSAPLLSSGDMASLVQPLAFGMGFWRMEAAMHKYPHQALRSTAAQLFAVFVGSALYCYGIESAGLPQPTLTIDVVQEWFHEPAILAGLLWTGVVTTALTVYMETMALETMSAAETTLIFSTEPLWGTACAAAVMGEQLGIDAGIGAVLIVVGCLFSNLGWKGIQHHFAFPGMPASVATSQGDSALGDSGTSPPTFAGTSTLAGGAAATVASLWNNLSVGAKVLAIQLEDLLQDLGALAER